jgi:biopolymer transport protein ExbD
MSKKKRQKIVMDEAEIPMSAMIDVVFLLLIYFIVTQKPIIEETLLSCDLPTPGGPPPDKPPTLMTIDVVKMFPQKPVYDAATRQRDLNLFYLNKRAWKFNSPEAPNDLRRQLISMGEADPEQTIIINCGPNAYHQKLVKLLDACAEANLTTLNVVNDESLKFNPPGR